MDTKRKGVIHPAKGKSYKGVWRVPGDRARDRKLIEVKRTIVSWQGESTSAFGEGGETLIGLMDLAGVTLHKKGNPHT